MQVRITLNKPHKAQQEVVDGRKRFTVLRNGRRWGKTLLAVYFIIKKLIDPKASNIVGYWCPVDKDLMKVWATLKWILKDLIVIKNEKYKTLTLLNGAELNCWSMNEPDSGRGFSYDLAVIDEAAKAPKLKEAWQQTIRATLADRKGEALIISTPKFGSYFNKLEERYKELDNWAFFSMPTSTNPYIDLDEIADAKKVLDPYIFDQEFGAEIVNLGNKPFMYCFDKSKLVFKDVPFNPKYPVYLSFDFNVDPATCLIAQIDPNFIHILDEIRLMNSDTYEICEHIRTSKYGNCHFIITGDASGMARSTVTRGNINNYTIILSELRCSEGQLKLPSANPPISESRTLCNAILSRHPNVMIAESCRYLIEDFQYVQVKDDNSIDKTTNAQRTHLLDTFRYLMNSFKPEFILYNR